MISADIHTAINEAMGLLPQEMNTHEARVMLLAIGCKIERP